LLSDVREAPCDSVSASFLISGSKTILLVEGNSDFYGELALVSIGEDVEAAYYLILCY